MNVIHIKDALRLLESGQPCNLKLWNSVQATFWNTVVQCVSAHIGAGVSIVFVFRHPA